MTEKDVRKELLDMLKSAEDLIKKTYETAKRAEMPSVMLPIKTMILPILKEIIAQLDGYRNDFVVDKDLEGWPRIGTYYGGRRVDQKIERVSMG